MRECGEVYDVKDSDVMWCVDREGGIGGEGMRREG